MILLQINEYMRKDNHMYNNAPGPSSAPVPTLQSGPMWHPGPLRTAIALWRMGKVYQ